MSKTGDFTDKYPPKICPVCGNPFAKPSKYSLTQWAAKAYCSNRCRGVDERTGTHDGKGYRLVATDQGQRRNARVVMEQVLGRALQPGEVVHHVNGDKMDDRPENLRVFSSNGEHTAQHWRENPWHEQLAAARKARWG